MAEIACTHPARIKGKDGKLVCLTCGAEIKPEKPAKKTEKTEDKTEDKAAE